MGKKILVPCFDVIMIAFFYCSLVLKIWTFTVYFSRKRRSLLHQNAAQNFRNSTNRSPANVARKKKRKKINIDMNGDFPAYDCTWEQNVSPRLTIQMA